MIERFVDGAREAFGVRAHVEGDALFCDGWWQAGFRVGPGVFLVRNEPAPDGADVPEALAAVLRARGLAHVGTDLPAIQPVVYTTLSLGSTSWALFASDLATGEAALAQRATGESFFDLESGLQSFSSVAPAVEVRGARRLAGLPPSVVLAVGLEDATVRELQAALPDCTFEARAVSDVDPDACGELLPTLMLVDATDEVGRRWVMEVRASACGRFIPLVAVAAGPEVPLGADEVVDPAAPATRWAETMRALLP